MNSLYENLLLFTAKQQQSLSCNICMISHATCMAVWSPIFNTGFNILSVNVGRLKHAGVLVKGFGWELELAHRDCVYSVERDPDDLLTQQVDEVVLAHQQ